MIRGPIITYFTQKCLSGILTILIILAGLRGSGQTIKLKGRVLDTLLNRNCQLAVVAILNRDSSMVQFTRTRKDGSFSFHEITAGTYRLLVTHPAYADYRTLFTAQADGLTDLGMLAMTPKADTLEAVIVTPRTLPPRVHGDTLEFNTGHIRTRTNASVEELLARLPGVQIDLNGGITVNGKKIERLLVDGEDFFGGNPTIATRNLNADMIAKVQVLDRRSEQAQFTGIDDGKRTKTLNLTLKEDSKKGYFSRLEAGGDPKGHYNVNGLLGSFKVRQQFAALGMAANTGITGFSGNVGSLGSGLDIGGGSNDALGASAGVGIPQVMGGGMHYANKWNENHGVGNYQYGRLISNPYSSSIVKQILPDSVYTQEQESHSHNNQDQHGLNADFDYVPDSVSAFRFTLGGVSKQENNEFSSSGSSSFNDTLVNSSLRAIRDEVNNRNFYGTGMWRIQGGRNKGRRFSAVTAIIKQDNTTKGFLFSQNTFYKPDNNLLRADTIDQRKLLTTSSLFLSGALNYMTPLWKFAGLGLSYALSFSNSQSQQSTYNKGDGKYEDHVDSLSNHYQNIYLSQGVTLSLQGTNKGFSYTIGGDLLDYRNKQKDMIKSSAILYQYFSFSPHINARYNIHDCMDFNFNYNGTSLKPDITQLQPVQNNNDPLHITIGNPGLRPSFSHSFWLGINVMKPVMMSLNLNYGFITTGISTRTYTDSLGRQTSQAVNTSGSNNAGVKFSINKKISSLDLDLGVNGNLNYTRNVNYVNQYLSRNDMYNTGGGISLNKFVADKYSFQLNSNFSYSYSRSSINPNSVTHYWTQAHSAAFTVFLMAGFELNSNCYYSWRQKIDHFDRYNTNVLWNAYLLKNFFSNTLAVSWQIDDILGQNTGISRTISANQTRENAFNIIGRYWMVVASYRFMHHKKAN